MRHIVLALLAPVLCLMGAVQAQNTPSEKINLKLLYAGQPGSEREKEFVAFLSERFAQVKTADLARFTPNDANGSDVVLFDYAGDGFKAPRPRLPQDYARATVAMGVIGAFICDQQGLKTGYM
jgi:hypothetical protein